MMQEKFGILVESPSIPSSIDNLNIRDINALLCPNYVKETVKVNETVLKNVIKARERINDILHGKSNRKIVIVGPCSIHDIDVAYEYAKKLNVLRTEYFDDLEIVMRVYFEKPRSVVGWKGLINDPDLDGSCDVNKGLIIGRLILKRINELGIPCAAEYLESYTPQYIDDLICYAAIGARTSACSLHQDMSSGLSCCVGFKNLTDGNIEAACEGAYNASKARGFLGITYNGQPAWYETTGNNDCHIILRGSNVGTNYTEIENSRKLLNDWKLPRNGIIVDCSHGNSQKDHTKQNLVVKYLIDNDLFKDVAGIMIESFLHEGNQSLDSTLAELNSSQFQKQDHDDDSLIDIFSQKKHVLSKLKYGISITDKCISFSETENLLNVISGYIKIDQ